MTEWSNVLVLKASVPMVPWVRIPLCPCVLFLITIKNINGVIKNIHNNENN